MADLYTITKEQIDKIIAEYKVAYADKKLTLSEIWTLTSEAIESFQVVVAAFAVEAGDKKAVVMIAAGKFYDEVIAPIDIPSINNIIEPTVDRLGRSLFLELVSGAYDFILKSLPKPPTT
jgi:hypothetical protein